MYMIEYIDAVLCDSNKFTYVSVMEKERKNLLVNLGKQKIDFLKASKYLNSIFRSR